MNWGKAIANASILLGAGASVGYIFAGDWRKSLYFLLGSAITATVVYLL